MSSTKSIADLLDSLSIPKPGLISARLWCHGITRSDQVTEAYLPVINEALDSPPSETGRLTSEKITEYVFESTRRGEASRPPLKTWRLASVTNANSEEMPHSGLFRDRPFLLSPDDADNEWSAIFVKPQPILVRLATIGLTKISDLVTVSESTLVSAGQNYICHREDSSG